MTRARLWHQVRHRPKRRPGLRGDQALNRRPELRPARAVVGLDLPSPVTGDLWQHVPTDHLRNAPASREAYLGRVEEVTRDTASVRLWSIPAGVEVLAELSIDDRLERTRPPCEGDAVLLFTWIELPGNGREVAKQFAKLLPTTITDAQREELRRLLEEDEA